MTKFDGRTLESANQQIEESLKRLQTDRLDLLQFHENIRFDDPDRFFAKGGAAEALVAAKKSGKTRFIGFTGHKDPRIHLYMLELARKNRFHFDSIQMPLNVMDAHFRSFRQVIPTAQEMGLAILGMKSMGSGVILKSKTVTPVECLTYALTLPTSVVITGIDKDAVLDQAVHVASTFKPLTVFSEIATLLKKIPAEGRQCRGIRALQDLLALRQHRSASGMVGPGNETCSRTRLAFLIAYESREVSQQAEFQSHTGAFRQTRQS